MTARTAAPAGPEEFAAAFVAAAQRIVERCLTHHPDVDRRGATLRLACVLGGSGWIVTAGGQVLDQGADPALAQAAHALVRSAVHSLDIESQARLLERMDDGADPLPGTEVPHFKAVLATTGASWELRVLACSRGASAVLASIAGSLAPAAHRAAA